jgi:hypothetical protein
MEGFDLIAGQLKYLLSCPEETVVGTGATELRPYLPWSGREPEAGAAPEGLPQRQAGGAWSVSKDSHPEKPVCRVLPIRGGLGGGGKGQQSQGAHDFNRPRQRSLCHLQQLHFRQAGESRRCREF